MDFTIRGNLLLEKNPMFADPSQSLGSNGLKYLIITCFGDEVDRFKNIILANNKKPISDRKSYPIQFERIGKTLSCHVMCKLRNPQPDTLLKRIDFESNLRQVPMQEWIGKEFLIRVRAFKYDFKDTLDPELLGGGSSMIRRGYTYHIKSINAP